MGIAIVVLLALLAFLAWYCHRYHKAKKLMKEGITPKTTWQTGSERIAFENPSNYNNWWQAQQQPQLYQQPRNMLGYQPLPSGSPTSGLDLLAQVAAMQSHLSRRSPSITPPRQRRSRSGPSRTGFRPSNINKSGDPNDPRFTEVP